MASLKDVEQLADDLEGLVGQLRKELKNGAVDFDRLIAISDEISEHADGFAETFATVNDALASRIDALKSGSHGGGGSSSQSSSRASGVKSGSRS